jgi:NADPH:quinone reductase-like Zn-dependent oxidoreductase
MQALFQRLELSLPSKTATSLPELSADSPQVLIWSGATAVGQYAIQLARAAGYHVITTASPKNHALLEQMGAAEIYDYRDENVPEKISKEHPNLSAALDCISEGGTQSLAVRSLGSKGGKVTVLLKPEDDAKKLRNDVQIIHTL